MAHETVPALELISVASEIAMSMNGCLFCLVHTRMGWCYVCEWVVGASGKVKKEEKKIFKKKGKRGEGSKEGHGRRRMTRVKDNIYVSPPLYPMGGIIATCLGPWTRLPMAHGVNLSTRFHATRQQADSHSW